MLRNTSGPFYFLLAYLVYNKTTMKNKEIAKVLYNIAFYLQMGDVPFKPQAYEKAAMALESFSQDVGTLYKNEGLKGLESIPGIGKSIAEKIEEYLKTGKIKYYEDFKKQMPLAIDELTLVEGVGPKMVRDLWKHLKIKNLKDLEYAARAGKISKLPNFGKKTEQNILQSIEFLKRSKGRWLLGDIVPYAQGYLDMLKNSGLVKEAEIAGSLRRMEETVGDIDILVTSKNPKKAIEYFLSKIKYNTQGFDVDVRVLSEDTFGAGLQYFTGSKEHNVKLRTYAAGKGYKVSEYGVFKGKKRVACKTEQQVYGALGMRYIEPELREDTGEIEAALTGKLPRLIPYGSLKGDLQVQTNWTDGADSIETMAKAAKKQGLQYIAITDHTKDLAMVRGSDEKKLLRQMAEIDKFNAKGLGIKILKGAEVNIRKDGTLDIADDVLAKLDVVGASVHSNFKMTKKDMTERIIRAIQNPNVDILFHPTGRSMPKRDEYDLDIDAVLAEAKKTGTVVEINAQPRRLDLRDVYIRKAVAQGVPMVIDSDAHSQDQFEFLRYGISQARRGWAGAKDVINTQALDKFLKLLKNN